MTERGHPRSASPDAGANIYLPPNAPVADGRDEASMRRDGPHLVIRRHGRLTSMCGHCGSQQDLQERTVAVVWRNPVGCLTALGVVLGAIVVLAIADHIPYRSAIVPWSLGAAGLAVIVVNVAWRSVRVGFSYSLCLACRARRGRWLIYWLAALLAVAVVSYFLHLTMLLLALPMCVVASRPR